MIVDRKFSTNSSSLQLTLHVCKVSPPATATLFFFAFIGQKGKNHFPWWCWSPQFWKSGLAVCLKSPKPWSYQSVQSLDEADVWGDFPSCNCLKSPIGLLPLIHTKVWVDLQAQQLPCSSVHLVTNGAKFSALDNWALRIF